MSDYRPRDIYTRTFLGRTRYIRISPYGPDRYHPDYAYVQDCDGAGFLLNGRGRYLQNRTLDRYWSLHHRHETEDA